MDGQGLAVLLAGAGKLQLNSLWPSTCLIRRDPGLVPHSSKAFSSCLQAPGTSGLTDVFKSVFSKATAAAKKYLCKW
jgi:hypothetical protein